MIKVCFYEVQISKFRFDIYGIAEWPQIAATVWPQRAPAPLILEPDLGHLAEEDDEAEGQRCHQKTVD